MIPGIEEINFPAYATLHEATITFAEMGEDIITSQIRIDGDITPDFSDNWTLRYKGEEFVLNTHTPQAAKDNTSHCSFIDATFTSFPVAELKRYFFVELAEVEAGTMIVDKYNASLRVNAYNFIAALNRVLQYYFDGQFVVEVTSGTTLDPEVKDVELDYAYLWDAVGKLNEVYGLLWKLSKRNGIYYITVGNTAEAIAHVFEYGHSGGLTRIERQLEDAEIYNQLLGRGGTQNLPYRYFKKTDPYNEIWAADPDACAELENVYFERLMDINFRYYVKGWLRNPNRTPSADYPVPSTPEPAEIQQHWAYQKGLTDEKFQPVEYVEDAASVAEYGVRQGKLEDNDDIYPTIQGVDIPDDNPDMGRVDEIVAVGPITDGDDSGATEETSMSDILQSITTIDGLPLSYFTIYGPEFSISADRRGEVRYDLYMSDDTTGAVEPNFAYASTINTDYTKVEAERVSDGELFPVSSIPGGDTYRLKVSLVINKFPTEKQTTRTAGLKNVRLIASLPTAADDNPYCFRVWIKNIWQTAKGANENALEYMKRVWEPILGDRLGNEAKIVFSSGWMSASSDYEFTIVDWPVWDQSKTRNGVQSEWMLTLAKSDAEVESTGKYIPNATSPKPVAGDYFFFTGIDMPYWYVVWAEKRLNQTKQEALDTAAYANPTWAVQLDPVRIQTLEGNESVTLFDQLAVGKVMQIFDHRFSGGYTLGLGIRSMTVTWHAGAVMYPSVDIVLSEKVVSQTYVGRRILSMDEVNAQINSAVSGVASQMSATAQRSFLSKEHDDVAVGKLNMAAGATFGAISRYEDGAQPTGAEIPAAEIREDGHAEFDSLRLRKWLEVPELRYNRTEVQVGNQWRAPGGGIIESVVPDTDAQGNMLNTGIINLKLEDGEIGKVAVDDICMGIFHDSINENSNAVADMDDSRGNFKFSGFYTTYFRITDVQGANNQCFKYILRGVSERWTQTFHPCAQMHFVCYGNFDGVNHADRQSSRYSTRTYERYLKNVNTWEFQPSNVAAQFGELANLAELGLPGMTGYSTYIENIYMTGHIKQAELPLHIEADWTGQNMLAAGDSVDIAFNVMQGFDNLNQQVASWTMERDSGDAVADAAWNQAYDGWDGNVATLSSTDLGADGLSTLFLVTATMDDEAHTEVDYGFTLMQSQDASNVVMLDLDNENDSMLYTKDGTLLSGSVTSNAILKVGNDEITTGVTFSISASTGITASISGNVVTVSAMGAVSSGYVLVSAIYGGRTYTKQLNLTKLVGDVKYDLFITPDSIGYNTTTGNITTQNVVVKVYRTGQDSNGDVVKEVASQLPSGWALKVDGTSVTYPGSAGYTIPINATALTGRDQYIISLVRANNTIADEETIPVNTVTNGTNGSDGKGIVSTEIRYARSSNGTSAPSSGWNTTIPSATTTYPYIWTRTTITYTSGDPSVSYSVSMRGANGSDGSDGSTGPQGPQGPGGADAIHLDLDNENASFLYNAEGTLISGSVISTATLYSGGSPVTSGVTWAISERSGCTSTQATISGGVVTITGINTAGYVMVRASYGGVYYYAKLYLIKIIGEVMYDLVVSPNAIACNTTTGAKSASTFNVKIYSTKQTSAGVVRSLESSVPTGYTLMVDGSSKSSSYSSGYTHNVDTSRDSHTVTLLYGTSSSTIIADEETIPINKSANGAAGDLGPALVYRGDWSTMSSSTYFYSNDQRVDVVKYNNNYYKCKQYHQRSTTSSKTPGYNSGDSDYWKDFGDSFSSVATGLLLSEEAYIQYLGAYGLRILDANGNVVGGAEAATASDPITFWLGAAANNKSGAPFRINGSGGVTATSGTIGGLSVDGTTMKFIGSGTTVVGGMSTATTDTGNTGISLWLGSDTKSTNAPFYVTRKGVMKATGADISGKVTADEGKIAGFTLNSSGLQYGNDVYIWSGSTAGLGIDILNRQNLFRANSANYTPVQISQSAQGGTAASFEGGYIDIKSALRLRLGYSVKGLASNYTLPSTAVEGHTELLYTTSSNDITISAPSNKTIYRGTRTSSSIKLTSGRYFAILYYDGSSWRAFQPDCIVGD